MKEINELVLPEELRYAKDHEWAKSEGSAVRVGIDDYAQDQLGDIVYVELPKVGDRFARGDAFGTVESVKAVSELFMPVGGQITATNGKLEDSPELVNTSPYTDGWMITVAPDDPGEMEDLMTKNAYLDMLKGL